MRLNIIGISNIIVIILALMSCNTHLTQHTLQCSASSDISKRNGVFIDTIQCTPTAINSRIVKGWQEITHEFGTGLFDNNIYKLQDTQLCFDVSFKADKSIDLGYLVNNTRETSGLSRRFSDTTVVITFFTKENKNSSSKVYLSSKVYHSADTDLFNREITDSFGFILK
jgi:hypothetical protein